MQSILMRFKAGLSALVLAIGACSSSSSTGGGGGGPSDGGPVADAHDGAGSDGGDGGGLGHEADGGVPAPCRSGDQQACDACISATTKTCNAGMCRKEDIALENCSVLSVYYPCEDETGHETIDCCQFEMQMLIACWNRCPEVMACS